MPRDERRDGKELRAARAGALVLFAYLGSGLGLRLGLALELGLELGLGLGLELGLGLGLERAPRRLARKSDASRPRGSGALSEPWRRSEATVGCARPRRNSPPARVWEAPPAPRLLPLRPPGIAAAWGAPRSRGSCCLARSTLGAADRPRRRPRATVACAMRFARSRRLRASSG